MKVEEGILEIASPKKIKETGNKGRTEIEDNKWQILEIYYTTTEKF